MKADDALAILVHLESRALVVDAILTPPKPPGCQGGLTDLPPRDLPRSYRVGAP